MAGTNDLAHMDIDEYKERYIELISAIQDSIPGIDIVIESVLPTNTKAGGVNTLLTVKCRKQTKLPKV